MLMPAFSKITKSPGDVKSERMTMSGKCVKELSLKTTETEDQILVLNTQHENHLNEQKRWIQVRLLAR